MKPEQQRIAIAEACGWRIAERVLSESKEEAIACWIRPNGKEWQEQILPNYTEDLNAMHEAEKVLTEDQREQYLNSLYKVCNPDSMLNDAWNLNCATAAQRAEAFLRAIGKWEGE